MGYYLWCNPRRIKETSIMTKNQPKITRIYSHVTRCIAPLDRWYFNGLPNFCWQPWIPLVKCKCITPGWQVAIVRVHNVSVRNSAGIEVANTAVKTATDRIPEICIWNSSTQISANRQISSPRECHIWRRVKCITEGNCNEYMMECNPPNPTSIQYWDLLLATIVIMSVWTDKQC